MWARISSAAAAVLKITGGVSLTCAGLFDSWVWDIAARQLASGLFLYINCFVKTTFSVCLLFKNVLWSLCLLQVHAHCTTALLLHNAIGQYLAGALSIP